MFYAFEATVQIGAISQRTGFKGRRAKTSGCLQSSLCCSALESQRANSKNLSSCCFFFSSGVMVGLWRGDMEGAQWTIRVVRE